MSLRVPRALADELYRRAEAGRWHVPPETFASALERSAAKAFPGRTPSSAEIRQYVGSLRLGDLALACACEEGADAAWDHFVLEYRPILYRAADALDPTGRAREIADSLYAKLYGLRAGAANGVRSSVISTAEAVWPPGSAPYWPSGTSIGCVPTGGRRHCRRRSRPPRPRTHLIPTRAGWSPSSIPRCAPRSTGSTRGTACASATTTRRD